MENRTDQYWIPRNLDAPKLFFVWELDIAMIFIITLVLCGVLNMFIPGLVLAYVLTRFYSQLKEEGGRGLIIKLLYWFSPSNVWISRRLPSHIREYIG